MAASNPARARKAPSARRPNCLPAGKSQATKASCAGQLDNKATCLPPTEPRLCQRAYPRLVQEMPPTSMVHTLLAAQRITCQMPVKTVCRGNARPQDSVWRKPLSSTSTQKKLTAKLGSLAGSTPVVTQCYLFPKAMRMCGKRLERQPKPWIKKLFGSSAKIGTLLVLCDAARHRLC